MKTIFFMMLLCLASSALTQEHGHEHNAQDDAATTDTMARLSPELQELLRKEMQLLQDGLRELSVQMPQGGWDAVAEIAGNMRDSFILKKSLKPSHIEELKTRLPHGFVQLDRRFHDTAGKLVHAAHNRDVELSVFYQARMLEACANCHAEFAPKRFPGLAQAETAHEH